MSKPNSNVKIENEILHGLYLSQSDPEEIWGWGTPAGQRRALNRTNLIVQAANLEPGMKVLEIGCGTGSFTKRFAETGVNLIAVDISPDLLRIAREKVQSNQVSFIEGRFEELVMESSFDAVIGSSVLHHLDIEPALRNIFSLLKPGGTLSFAEPNYLNPQVFLMFTFRQFFPEVSPDENAFIKWKLIPKLKNTGFEKSTIIPFDWLHPSTPEACVNQVEKIGEKIEKIPVLREFAGSLLINAKKPQ